MDNNTLPWDRPRVKRILELFPNSRVFNIKRITNVKVVSNNEIYR